MDRPGLIGRYQVLDEVGRGAMGVVYRARTPDGQPVALKLLLAGRTASALQRRRIATEIQALLRLRHPNVVALLDAGEHEGVPWLTMEWVEGRTLADRLEREGPLDPRDGVALIRRLCTALEHCHDQGVLHRDLKPENVILRSSDGAPLLTDFGLSKDMQSESLTTSGETLVGRWLGTPGYWPPEQARGHLAAIGPRSDVYGLGALLYSTLTGLPPQAGQTLQEMIDALCRPPDPPSLRRPGVPAWLDAVCLSALEIDPERRPASPAELSRALSREPMPGHRSVAVPLVSLVLLLAGSAVALHVASRAGAAPAERRPGQESSATELAAAPSSAASDRGEALGQLLKDADARAHSDPAGALRDYDRALELDPHNALIWSNRGALRGEQGDRDGALRDYDRALELDPHNALIWCNRGALRSELADLDGALRDYDRALELEPQYLPALINRGALRSDLSDRDGALRDYDRALELEPQYLPALVNRGGLRKMQRDFLGARRDLDLALELDPRCLIALINRGELRRKQGDLDGARRDFDQALELQPLDPGAHLCRGDLCVREGDLQGAQRHYDRALELDPRHASAWVCRGALRQLQSNLEGASTDYDHAIELDPRHAPAWVHRGRLREAQGDLAGASTDYDRAIELDPLEPDTYIVRGNLRPLLGDLHGAIADYERALERAPDHAQAPLLREAVSTLRSKLRDGSR